MSSPSSFDQEYFSGNGSNYKDYTKMDDDQYWLKRLNPILNYVQSGHLLELGCAYGYFLKRATNSFNVYGLDISKFALEQAKRNCPKAKLEAWDINTSLPFRDEGFDVIASFDTLEHVANINFCVKEISRVLKKNGLLVLQIPIKNVIMNLLGFLDSDKTHVSVMPEEQICNLLYRNSLPLILRKSLWSFSPSLDVWSSNSVLRHVFPHVYYICRKNGQVN